MYSVNVIIIIYLSNYCRVISKTNCGTWTINGLQSLSQQYTVWKETEQALFPVVPLCWWTPHHMMGTSYTVHFTQTNWGHSVKQIKIQWTTAGDRLMFKQIKAKPKVSSAIKWSWMVLKCVCFYLSCLVCFCLVFCVFDIVSLSSFHCCQNTTRKSFNQSKHNNT